MADLAAAMVLSRSSVVSALLMNQLSKAEGGRYTPRSSMAWKKRLNNSLLAADAAVKSLIEKSADGSAYQIAEVYGLRKDPDGMFTWLDRAWDTRDSGIGRLLTDPFILRYRNDPRFAAFCKKVGLPATTDAMPMQ